MPPLARVIAWGAISIALLLIGCAETVVKPSDQHIQAQPTAALPPMPLAIPPTSPTTRRREMTELYNVHVEQANARELLFALARDAKLDIDVATDIEGTVTLNLRNRTLPHILDRIADQIDMRWEIIDGTIRVRRDTPYARIYQVDYVNLSRASSSSISITTQIGGEPSLASTSGSTASSGGGGGASGSNASAASLTTSSHNQFWGRLTETLNAILLNSAPPRSTPSLGTTLLTSSSESAPPASPQTTAQAASATNLNLVASPPPQQPQQSPPPSQATPNASTTTATNAASIVVNPETGIIVAFANEKQHRLIKEYLDRLQANASRQVLIEATVVEVSLNDEHQSGIDWGYVARAAGFSFGVNSGLGVGILKNALGASEDIRGPGLDLFGDERNFPQSTQNSGVTIGWSNANNFAAAVKLLSNYGHTKVLSSPKITVVNNQTAVLRVADNVVYFQVEAQTTSGTAGSPATTTWTTTPKTVAVGLTMQITPQIDAYDMVSLAVRPSITRLQGYVRDPNPALTQVANLVPIVQTRELDSIVRVPSNSIVMMGGLMEDRESRTKTGLPGLSDITGVDSLFGTKSVNTRKTELVIFLRPRVIYSADIEHDFRAAKGMLPTNDFFSRRVWDASTPR